MRVDGQKIDDKLKRITWVGDSDLIHAYELGHITSHRHPAGKPRAPGARGRIIKISLPSQELRNSLLAHMRSGRQSLTERFVHSYARRDYTAEELQLDRSLRKQAGDLNAREDNFVHLANFPGAILVQLLTPPPPGKGRQELLDLNLFFRCILHQPIPPKVH
ncbi:hypothetical protein ANCDUO_11599 [Ancylostoma duodenale]|uniref:Uncharacterized protein n=1 Tax=Ancylostoma duodenale TaxID=51022 RepID=A0A0C2D7S6_9BILA|nr:hypothetical protein ANCDUO_11599 [Ancylostoma duodenale]